MTDDGLYISREPERRPGPTRPLQETRAAFAANRRRNGYTIAGAALAALVGLAIGYAAPNFTQRIPPRPEFDESIPVAMKLVVKPPAPPPPISPGQYEPIPTLSETPTLPVPTAPPAQFPTAPSPKVGLSAVGAPATKAEEHAGAANGAPPHSASLSPEIAALIDPSRRAAPDLNRLSPEVGRAEPREATGRGPGARRRPLQGPSFSCLGDIGRTEAMICAEPELSAADRRLAAAFNRSMRATDNPERLMREQNRWLAQRDRLGQNYNAVLDHYDRRLDELWTPE